LEKIRVAAVSYLNTKPLLFGIRKHPVFQNIDLVEGYPAAIAEMLTSGEVDIALLPVAAVLKLKEWHIITDTCIGCEGPVASVCIFSECPIEDIEEVYLDYQSRTSINLAKILLKEYWKVDVRFVSAAGEDFRKRISGTTAGVVIGDRALEQRLKSSHAYDLGEAWKAHTGLPFVFAAWIANKPIPKDFEKQFQSANELGLSHIDEVIAANPFPHFDLGSYFRKFIDYKLDDRKKMGMHLYLEKLKSIFNAN